MVTPMPVIGVLIVVCGLVATHHAIFDKYDFWKDGIIIVKLMFFTLLSIVILGITIGTNYEDKQIIDVPGAEVIVTVRNPKGNWVSRFFELRPNYEVERVMK